MPSPLPFPRKPFAALALVLALAGCQPGSAKHPVPSVPQIGADLKCSGGDHGYEDQQAGWGFCYPGTWRYNERSQGLQSPPGLDLTFDITCLSNCKPSCPAPVDSNATTTCAPESGLFGFMIISTYERGTSPNLASWIDANLTNPPSSEQISWGNAVEAAKLADGRRIALTKHHVVILELRPGPLDLESEMSSRLVTWKFSF
jgi:hypothetical protein